jgi:hypothetical protein
VVQDVGDAGVLYLNQAGEHRAIYSLDRTGCLVLPARGRAFFVEDIDSDSMESAELVTQAQLERIAADDGVIGTCSCLSPSPERTVPGTVC